MSKKWFVTFGDENYRNSKIKIENNEKTNIRIIDPRNNRLY